MGGEAVVIAELTVLAAEIRRFMHRVWGHPPADLYDVGPVQMCRSCYGVLDFERGAAR